MTSTLTSPRPMRRRPAIRPVPGLLCSLVSALLLSACGGSAPEDPPATPTSDTLGDTVRHLVLLNEAAVAGSDRMRILDVASGKVTKVDDAYVEIDLGGAKVRAVKATLSDVIQPGGAPAND